MTLPCISNDRSTEVWPGKPWEYTPTIPKNLLNDKAKFLKWRGDEETQHMLFLGSEGVVPTVRPNNETNPVRRLVAIIADYDAKIGPEMEKTLDKAPVVPNWISETYSGGRRLVWLFEEPVTFDHALTKAFYKLAARALQLPKLLPGLDETSYNSTRAFDVGTNWRQLNTKLLSKNTVQFWLFEAAKQTGFKTEDTEIPLDVVKAEIDKKWPGQWTGAFEVGARGPVFWEGRNNPSAAVVMENGIVAFSSHKLFHSWRDILGSAFVQQFTENKIGAVIDNVWFDGQKYYRRFNDDRWMTVAKEDFAKWLKIQGLDGRDLNGEPSEILQAEVYVQEHSRIDGIAPFLFNDQTIVEYSGQRLLNTSRVTALQPSTETGKWGEKFPFIAKMLDSQFGEEQMPYWLGWMKRLYCSSLAGRLEKGQAVFLVGPVNSGKTLIGQHIVGPLVGGCADASDYIAGDSDFNKHLIPTALWVIDDGKVAADNRTRSKFGEMVKRIVANPQMIYRAMYNDAQMINWNGRLLVTLNADSYSILMVPNLATSMEEKVMIFKIDKPKKAWPTSAKLESTIAAELPHFARFLVDMELPKHVIGESRLGIQSFVHEEIRYLSMHASGVGDLMESIELWKGRTTHKEEPWEGTYMEWYAEMLSDEVLRSMVSKQSPRAIGLRFAEAAQVRDSGITVIKQSNAQSRIVYRISRKEKNES